MTMPTFGVHNRRRISQKIRNPATGFFMPTHLEYLTAICSINSKMRHITHLNRLYDLVLWLCFFRSLFFSVFIVALELLYKQERYWLYVV